MDLCVSHNKIRKNEMIPSVVQLSENEPGLSLGSVKSILDGKYLTVDAYGRTAKAKKAASCLLTPVVQDTVLLAFVGETSYILAVIEQKDPSASSIVMEGDVSMTAPNGTLTVSAKEGIALTTSEALSLAAKRLGLSGEALNAVFQHINIFGHVVEAGLTDIKLFSKRLESKMESAVQHFVRRHAKVEGLDSVTAGNIRQTAENLLSLRSAFSFFKAKKNVKIDGKQIFMG